MRACIAVHVAVQEHSLRDVKSFGATQVHWTNKYIIFSSNISFSQRKCKQLLVSRRGKKEEVKHPIQTESMDLDGWLCMCGDYLNGLDLEFPGKPNRASERMGYWRKCFFFFSPLRGHWNNFAGSIFGLRGWLSGISGPPVTGVAFGPWSPVDSDVECPLEAKILQTEIGLPL